MIGNTRALSPPPASPTRSSSCCRLARPLFGLVWLGFILARCSTTALPRSRRRCSPQIDAAARRGWRSRQRHPRQRDDERRSRWRLGTPIGLFAGTYLAEYGRYTRFAFCRALRQRHSAVSAPSIVTGLFIYEIVVVPMGHFSAWAGAAVADGDRDPGGGAHDREHAAAGAQRLARSGQRRWARRRSFVIRAVTWRAARAGIITGVLLAVARISGETAPLLFTALNNQF